LRRLFLFVPLFDHRRSFESEFVDKRLELLPDVLGKFSERHRFALFGDRFLCKLFFDFTLIVGKEIFDDRDFHRILIFYVLK